MNPRAGYSSYAAPLWPRRYTDNNRYHSNSCTRRKTSLAGVMMSGQGGLRKLDVGVLSAEQQEKLRQYKIRTRMDNEEYLTSHPEVQLLISDFLRHVLHKRPDDIHEFAADHFANSNLCATYGCKREVNKVME